MPTLDASWTGRLRVIGELELQDHWYLGPVDECVYFGEYTARAGYAHSATNQLILNLKKKPETRGTPQWRYKEKAIRDIGHAIARNLTPEGLAQITIVPIPPSKPPGSPSYDDRMAQVARAVGPNIDLREVLVTTCEREAMHVAQNHRDPDALRATLTLDRDLLAPLPIQVLLLDDVLTTGCSFRTCKAMLLEAWPDAKVFGLFVARRVIDPGADFDFENIEL